MKLFRIFNTFVVSAFAVVAFSSCSGNETDYALDVAENLTLDKAGQLAVCAWVCGHVEIEAGIESREILPALCDGSG